MKNKDLDRKKEEKLPPCDTSQSCAEHARLWDDVDEPCDDGRGILAKES